MVNKVFSAKPFVNKNTKQVSILIPKKKMKMFKNRIPKSIKFKIEEIIW